MNKGEAKIYGTFDSAGIKKGVKDADKHLSDLKKDATKAGQELLSSFGAVPGAMGKVSDSMAGMAAGIAKHAGASSASVAKISASFGAIGIAVGAAVTAVTAGFAAMKRAAEGYFQTVEGSIAGSGLNAYVDTFKGVVAGAFQTPEIAEFFAKFKKGWTGLTQDVKLGATNMALWLSGRGKDTVNVTEVEQQAAKNAAEAERIGKRQQELSLQEIKNRERIAELDATIAQARLVMSDQEADIYERAQAVNTAQGAIAEKYRLQREVAEELADLTAQMNALSPTTVKDLTKEVELRTKATQLAKQEAQELRALNLRGGTINREIKVREDKAAARQEFFANVVPVIDNSATKALRGALVEGLTDGEGHLAITVTPEVDMQSWEITADELNGMVAGIATDMATIFGDVLSSIGTGNAGEVMAAGLLDSIGNVAIRFGELAIGIGVAAKGIQEALKLHPVAAIVGGAALVALGRVASNAAANIASSAGGGYTAANTATYSQAAPSAVGAGDYIGTDINITIGGTLKARGNDLVAVLSNENARLNATT